MTTNPQLENGYTQIANELIEALARFNLSPYESRLLWYIVRKTYGYQKKTDAISLGQFALGTGIPVSNVIRTLRKLESRHFITKSKDFYVCEYGINKHYDQWLTTICTDSTQAGSISTGSAPVDSAQTDNEVLPPQTITTAPADNKLLPPQRDTKERKIPSKDTIKRNTSAAVKVETCKEVFMTFKKNERYNGIDFENDFQKMCEWYNGKKKKVTNQTLVCHNWLDGSLEDLLKAKNNGNGHKDTLGKVGSFVNLPAPDPDREAVKADLIRQMEEKT